MFFTRRSTFAIGLTASFVLLLWANTSHAQCPSSSSGSLTQLRTRGQGARLTAGQRQQLTALATTARQQQLLAAQSNINQQQQLAALASGLTQQQLLALLAVLTPQQQSQVLAALQSQ